MICRASHSAVGCRVTSNTQQLSPAMTQDQERKQEIKSQRRHNAHIDGGDRLGGVIHYAQLGLLGALGLANQQSNTAAQGGKPW